MSCVETLFSSHHFNKGWFLFYYPIIIPYQFIFVCFCSISDDENDVFFCLVTSWRAFLIHFITIQTILRQEFLGLQGHFLVFLWTTFLKTHPILVPFSMTLFFLSFNTTRVLDSWGINKQLLISSELYVSTFVHKLKLKWHSFTRKKVRLYSLT